MEHIILITNDELEFFKDTPELLEEIRESERKVNKIYTHLLKGENTFSSLITTHNYRREALVHASPEPQEFKRVTTFDDKGPIGHFTRNNLKELAQELHMYGFEPISKEDLKILY